jgi:hypothetical protein
MTPFGVRQFQLLNRFFGRRFAIVSMVGQHTLTLHRSFSPCANMDAACILLCLWCLHKVENWINLNEGKKTYERYMISGNWKTLLLHSIKIQSIWPLFIDRYVPNFLQLICSEAPF